MQRKVVKKSIKKNAILNIIKSAMSIIFPLITFPYVSNILGVEELGKYNFAFSINNYLLMIAALGIATYAVREGAIIRDNSEKLNSFASEIYTINIISSLIAYGVMIISLILVPKFHDYKIYILLFSLEIFFTTIGVEWIYNIFEEYTYITIRRIAFQIISMVFLFIFVKNDTDILKYIGITVFANAGANILNVINKRKYCSLSICFHGLRKHIKPIMIIFASTLAVKIYTSSDVIMLGFLKDDQAVGLYSVAIKVYNVIKPLLSAVLIVAVPRLASYIGNKNRKEYLCLLEKIFNILVIIVFPASVGIFMLSKQIILLLSNKSYLQAENSLKFLCIAIVFSLFSTFFNQCVLIPNKLEKKFLLATILSATINICLNFILIVKYSHTGAAITTVVAEFISMFMCYWGSKQALEEVNYKEIILNVCSVIVGCISICVVCTVINKQNFSNTINIIMAIVFSAIVYVLSLLLMKNKLVITMINQQIKKLNSKKHY